MGGLAEWRETNQFPTGTFGGGQLSTADVQRGVRVGLQRPLPQQLQFMTDAIGPADRLAGQEAAAGGEQRDLRGAPGPRPQSCWATADSERWMASLAASMSTQAPGGKTRRNRQARPTGASNSRLNAAGTAVRWTAGSGEAEGGVVAPQGVVQVSAADRVHPAQQIYEKGEHPAALQARAARVSHRVPSISRHTRPQSWILTREGPPKFLQAHARAG